MIVMSHYSKKGSVHFESNKNRYAAFIKIDDKGYSYRSRFKTDCEAWLEIMRNGGNANERTLAANNPVKSIVEMGGTNPHPIPGFPMYYLTDEGDVWSVKHRIAIKLRRNKGKYFVLTENHNGVSCTLERLQYSIAHNVSPLAFSLSKLSVVRKNDGELKLVDCTEYCKDCQRKQVQLKWSNVKHYLEENVEWSRYLIAYYDGDNKKLIEVKQMLEQRRDRLADYLRYKLRVSDALRIRFVTDEVISEMMVRIVNKTALVISPMLYMEALARGINQRIRNVRGRVFCDNNILHVKGDLSKVVTPPNFNTHNFINSSTYEISNQDNSIRS